MKKPKTLNPARSSELVGRAAARTLLRLKRETVLRPIGPICMEEWQCCRDIIAEEMKKLLPSNVKGEPR
jgi:hypothetical protein